MTCHSERFRARLWPFSWRGGEVLDSRPTHAHRVRGFDQGFCRTTRSSAFLRASRAATLFLIAIGWMMCQPRHPPPPPPSWLFCLFRKTRIPSPRRQQAHFQGPMHPAARLRSASGRHDRGHPVLRRARTAYVRERCAATADRGPDGLRTRWESLGRPVAAGEGTASAFFQKAGWWQQGREVREAQHPPRSRSVKGGLGWNAVTWVLGRDTPLMRRGASPQQMPKSSRGRRRAIVMRAGCVRAGRGICSSDPVACSTPSTRGIPRASPITFPRFGRFHCAAA
jgi:hypothetical protein